MARRIAHRPTPGVRPPDAGRRPTVAPDRSARRGTPLRAVAAPARDGGAAVPPGGFGRLGRAAALAGALVYLAAISAYLVTHGGWPTPDYLVPPLLLIAIVTGRGWPFVLDWGPFLALVLSWQATAGIADQLGRPVHMRELVQAETWLFRGRIPTVELQARFFDPAQARWYDWAATVQHALHFVLPVAIGLVIWLRSRRTYWRYLASVLALFYLGFIGYALYPAAPPWMAGLLDVIPPVHRVAVETVLRLPASAPIGLAYTRFSYNQVAAMPSLHAGLPLLLALVLVRLWGRWMLPALLYPLTMGFNLVYLGEHWVVDVLAGYGVGLVAYGLVWLLPDLLRLQLRIELTRAPAPAGRRSARPPVAGTPGARALPPAHGGAFGRVAVRAAGNTTLAALAVASVAVVFATLRPGRAENVAGPVVPGLQVQAGQTGILTPVPCEEGASPSLTAGTLLLPVTGRYAVYLFDLDDGACYTLSANVSFPPPRAESVPVLAARAPVRLARLPQPQQGVEYLALHAGLPAAALVEAGLPPDHRYLLVVELADVADLAPAAQAADELAALVIAAEPPPAGPEPPPAEPEPAPAEPEDALPATPTAPAPSLPPDDPDLPQEVEPSVPELDLDLDLPSAP